MADTERDEQQDLVKAVRELAAKREHISMLVAYYDGNQPAIYLTKRLRELFRRIDVRFQENWCAVVIDSCADKIQLDEIQISSDESAQEKLSELWRTLRLAVDADDTHEMALIAAESYLIIGLDDVGEIVACYNDPRLCYVCYAADNPKKKDFAAKCWLDQDAGLWRLTLYYIDHFAYYEAPAKAGTTSKEYGAVYSDSEFPRPDAFVPSLDSEYPTDNPWGVIPVFHFRNKRDRSDLDNVIPLQDGINKLVADMLVAAEYQALPQRYAITANDTKDLKNAPGEIWEIPASDGTGQPTSVGQFAAADLSNFLLTVDGLVGHLAAITRTPKHYFIAQGGDPSGEALLAMEAPLNKKAMDRVERFRPEWRHAMSFLALLAGYVVGVEDIEPIFAKVETVQPFTQAQVRQLDVTAGIPLKTVLRRDGWSDAELEQLDADQAEKDAAAQAKMEAEAALAPKPTGGFPPNG